MGRKKLNRTKEELNEQANIRSKRYYHRHKDRINKKTMQRYWKRKEVVKKLPKM